MCLRSSSLEGEYEYFSFMIYWGYGLKRKGSERRRLGQENSKQKLVSIGGWLPTGEALEHELNHRVGGPRPEPSFCDVFSSKTSSIQIKNGIGTYVPMD
jgi:hypothetical protein